MKLENVLLLSFNQVRQLVPLVLPRLWSYGSLKEEMQVGINAYALYKDFNDVQSVVIEKSSGEHEFFVFKVKKNIMERDIIKETTLKNLIL
jgi:molybdopterin-containing oxidoreductase family iron-sulfur binding subunit